MIRQPVLMSKLGGARHMLGKQAKVVSLRELKRLLDYAAHGRYPERDRVLVLLSFKAGLGAKEIAGLRWSMVTDSSGQLADHLALPDRASKRAERRSADPDAPRATRCARDIDDRRAGEDPPQSPDDLLRTQQR